MLVSQNLMWVLSYIISEVFEKIPYPPAPQKKKSCKQPLENR